MISRRNEFIEELAKSILPQLIYIDDTNNDDMTF